MRRVVLTHLPGLNYFIGTFDLTNYQVWWKSAPLPGAIQTIEHALWVGGPMHLCLAKMVDGTWSIYLSFDYGVNWQLVKNSAVEIMDIELVTFTWILYSDANGDWWESTNSGFSWTKVCTAGPVGRAFFVLHKGETKTVFCHDGRYIKKSADIGRTWTTARDLNSVLIAADVIHPDDHYYTGIRTAAIAGANGYILAANGPYLAWSRDGGASFSSCPNWDEYGNDPRLVYEAADDDGTVLIRGRGQLKYPPSSIVAENRENFLINDIIVSSVDSSYIYDVVFMVQTKDFNGKQLSQQYKQIVVSNLTYNPDVPAYSDRYPVTFTADYNVYLPGSSDDFLYVDSVADLGLLDVVDSGKTLSVTATAYSRADLVKYSRSIFVKYATTSALLSHMFKTCTRYYAPPDFEGAHECNSVFKHVYQQAVSLGMLELASYQLLIPGGTVWDRLLFSAMSSVDDLGNPVVSLKYSIDGGLNYVGIDISQIEIYSGNVDEAPEAAGGQFTLFDYSNAVWVAGRCDNKSYWNYEDGYKIQMLSYDMDLIVTNDRSKPYTLDTTILHDRQKTYTLDSIINGVRSYGYYLSAYAQTIRPRQYRLDAEVQKIESEDYEIGATLCATFDVTYDIDARVSTLQRLQFYLYAAIQGPKSMGYTLDALITDSQADEMLVSFERRIPQLWNLITKPIPRQGGVYDSRIDPETD